MKGSNNMSKEKTAKIINIPKDVRLYERVADVYDFCRTIIFIQWREFFHRHEKTQHDKRITGCKIICFYFSFDNLFYKMPVVMCISSMKYLFQNSLCPIIWTDLFEGIPSSV